MLGAIYAYERDIDWIFIFSKNENQLLCV